MKHAKFFKSTFVIISFLQVSFANAQNWEVKLLDNINPQQPNSLVWKTTSSSTYPLSAALPVTLIVTGFINRDQHLQTQGWQAFGAIAIAGGTTLLLKKIVNRERPYIKYPQLIHPSEAETSSSFPSSHASAAFTTAATLSLEFKKWYVVVPAYTWAVAVGYSRLYLGAHYPTDILAGAVVGTGSALLSKYLTRKFFK